MSRDTDLAWEALVAAARLGRQHPPATAADFGIESDGTLRQLATPDADAALQWHCERGWVAGAAASPALSDLVELYQPLIVSGPSRPLIVGHLGQSLDGYVATESGDSHYVNGPENILHLHRIRALSDAVLVGAGTVAIDDPRLTTRLVSGENPTRVILDPYGRLSPTHRVFSDGAAPTLVVRAADASDAGAKRFGEGEIVSVPAENGKLDLSALLETLRARRLDVVLVEGGGRTVSAFLQAGLLDRLQLAVAPLLIGEGRRGVRLPASTQLQDCLRPSCRIFRMGMDVLFDCDLRRPAQT